MVGPEYANTKNDKAFIAKSRALNNIAVETAKESHFEEQILEQSFRRKLFHT
jgi:hypothetical protein